MKGTQTAIIEGPTEDKVEFWLMPPEDMHELELEFHFNDDVCPYPRPPGYNGLIEDWGSRTWCNPPFKGSKMAWARKAIMEWKKGKLVVLILGSGNLSHVFEVMADVEGIEIRLKNIRWMHPDGTQNKYLYGAILFILRPKSIATPSVPSDTPIDGNRPDLQKVKE